MNTTRLATRKSRLLTLSVEASNLTNAIYRQYMEQSIGMMERGAFYTGRSYSVRMGYSF